MKKFLVVLTMAAVLPSSSVSVNAESVDVPLQVGITDPTINIGKPHKSPIQIPVVSIDGHTLTVDTSCIGCELRLVDEDGTVVFTTIISSATLEIPSSLSGEYELQIDREIYYFYGYIDL